jgi:LCP family protein required for cell wall assembly
MRIKLTFVLLTLISLISACNFPMAPLSAPAAVSMNPNFLFNPTPLPTATPTPQIGSFTASQNFTPAGLIPQPKGQVNILLLGSDQRLGRGGFRTDTILLFTISPAGNTINITSFPRDLYVEIPGYTTSRINTALARGGFETLVNTFVHNFGVRPDYYVMINFWSFVDVIDSLGGIDVNASQPLSEYTARGWFTIPAGVNHMDGDTVLYYSRSRKSTSDFDRNRRQQEVIVAMINKLMSLYTIAKIPELYQIYVENVTTNIKLNDLIPLIPVAARIKNTEKIQNYYIGRGQVTSWTTPGGAAVLLPKRDAVFSVLRQALNSP